MSSFPNRQVDIIRFILQQEEDVMPKKYQNGKLEVRRDVKRPYYFVRATIVQIDGATGERKRTRKEHRLGFVDEISVKQARTLRAEALELINAGRFMVRSQLRFRDLARRFLDIRVPQLGIATQNKYRVQINNHLLPAFGEMRLCEIDRPSVEQFLNAKAELSWWSRIDLKGVLSAIFTVAKDWRLWEGENPTRGVRIGRKRLVREKRLLSTEELRTLIAALPERSKFIVMIIFGLGLRISEVLGLRWKDIDFDRK